MPATGQVGSPAEAAPRGEPGTDTTATPVGARGPARLLSLLLTTPFQVWAAFVVAALMRGTGELGDDALYYWWGAQDVVGAIASAPEDFWPMRGVLTALVYVPSALVVQVVGSTYAPLVVLVQNSLVLGWVAAFLLPRVVSTWRPLSTGARWGTGALVWLVTVGFAPYALVDIYPAAICLGLVVLLRSRRWFALVGAGILAGIALNLRPAYGVALAAMLAVAMWTHRWKAVWLVVGACLALVPQSLFNLARFDSVEPWPVDSGSLMSGQAEMASFMVRYDTMFGSDPPRRYYCSPAMAGELVDGLPSSAGELAGTFLETLPTSLWFAAEKVGAALHWSVSTPYTVPAPGLDVAFALLVTAVGVGGVAALTRRLLVARRLDYPPGQVQDTWLLAALAAGSVLAIVGAASESRFALPIVLVGVVGCSSVMGTPVRSAWRRHRTSVAVTAVVLGVTVLAGYVGLAHIMPPGDTSRAACRSLP